MNSSPEGLAISTDAAINIVDNNLSYGSWEQTAGYSDGDGGLLLTPEKYTMSLGFDWADTYKPQLEGVRRFLVSEGLRPERIYPLGKSKPVWHLRLSNQGDLLKALVNLEPLLIKKKRQAEAVIRYLRDEITGEQLVEAFNQAVLAGTRSGYLRTLRMPYTHSQGVTKGREFLRSVPRNKWRATQKIKNRIRARKQMGITMRDITEEAGISRSTVYRGLNDEGTEP